LIIAIFFTTYNNNSGDNNKNNSDELYKKHVRDVSHCNIAFSIINDRDTVTDRVSTKA